MPILQTLTSLLKDKSAWEDYQSTVQMLHESKDRNSKYYGDITDGQAFNAMISLKGSQSLWELFFIKTHLKCETL